MKAPTPYPLPHLLIALILLSLAGAFLWLHIATPSDGARLQPGQAVWQSEGVLLTPLEEQVGGLQEGDVLVAVDGRNMENWAKDLVQWDLPRPRWQFGEKLTYTVLRDGQLRDMAVTLGRYPLGAIIANDWGAILFAVINQLVVTYVFFKCPAERAAQALFLSATGMLSATTWSFGLQVSDLVGGTGFWLYKATTFGAYMLVWVAVLHLVLIFPREQALLVRAPWIVPLIYIIPYVVHALYVPAVLRRSPTVLQGLANIDNDVPVIQLVYLVLIVAGAISGYRVSRDPVGRRQVRWVFFALMLTVGIAAILGAIPEIFLGYPLVSWNWIALVGVLVPLALGFAILRYRLFDIDVLINRTLVYSALTAIIASLYILIVGLAGNWMHARTAGPHSLLDLMVSLIATGIVAVMFQPLRDWLQRRINRLMYGERNDPYTVLAQLGERLEDAAHVDTILPTIVETIAHALKLPYVAITLSDEEEETVAAESGTPPAYPPNRYPLLNHGETFGGLVLAQRSENEAFTPNEKRLLSDLARQVEVAAHNVRLTDDLQRSRQRIVVAREEERRRLRRDLHDGLGPQLASQTLTIDAISGLLDRDPDLVRQLLANLKAQSQAAIKDVRRLIYNLRPPSLDELGLVRALREASVNNGSSLQITIDAPDELPMLPAAVEVAAYRIVQEAIANVIHHAAAKRCLVRLEAVNSYMAITVEDDGCGLPDDVRAGVGLNSMRERAAELDGYFEIESSPGQGTRVCVRLPLLQEER